MSDQNFNLSNQDGVSIGHIFMSFQEKKNICNPAFTLQTVNVNGNQKNSMLEYKNLYTIITIECCS